jgi:hypothetical protein
MNETITSPAAGLSDSGNAVMSCGGLGAALPQAAPAAPAGNGTMQGGPPRTAASPARARAPLRQGRAADRRRRAHAAHPAQASYGGRP